MCISLQIGDFVKNVILRHVDDIPQRVVAGVSALKRVVSTHENCVSDFEKNRFLDFNFFRTSKLALFSVSAVVKNMREGELKTFVDPFCRHMNSYYALQNM